jgi:site-specific DNA recombinase
LRLCRLYAEKQGWIVAETYHDRAVSGLADPAPAIQALLADALRSWFQMWWRRSSIASAATRKMSPASSSARSGEDRTRCRIVAAVEDGLYQPTMKARLAEVELQKAAIEARLNFAGPELPDVHPNAAELYGRKVRELAEALAEDETSHETAATVLSLIGEVILYPGEKRGEVHATLRGELLGIPAFAHSRNTPRTIVYNNRGCRPPQPLLL